jgi:hypothetical protein
MPSNYSFRGTANMSQHDKALEKSASEVYKYEKKVQEANKQLDNFNKGCNNVASSVNNMMGSLRTGNLNGFLDNLNGIKSGFGEASGAADKLGLSIGKFAKGAGIAALGFMAVDAANKIKDLTNEGIQLALQAEGIKHRFEQIGGTSLYLEDLRKHTNGLVNDLELMKATVKANDFNIPMKDLGKYLEFAQLKSQQTGESVDYLVNSIVTGLGRQSVQILDNLGLSAAELKEKMAEGKTMTEAVAEVIDNQLKSAGEHFETTAEKAQRKLVELQNEQMRVGESLAPLKTDWDNFFTSIEIWALKAIAKLGALFSEAQRIKNLQNDMYGGGDGKPSRADREIEYFKKIGTEQSRKNGLRNTEDKYNREINKLGGKRQQLINQIAAERKRGADPSDTAYLSNQLREVNDQIKATRAERDKALNGMRSVMNQKNAPTPTFTPTPKGGGRSGGRTNPVKESPKDKIIRKGTDRFETDLRKIALDDEGIKVPYTYEPTQTPEEIKAQLFGDTSNWGNELQGNIDKLFGEANKVQLRFDAGDIDADEAQQILDQISKMIGLDVPIKLDTSKIDKANQALKDVGSTVNSVGSAFSSMGQAFELPELDVLGIIAQAVANIMLSYAQAAASPAVTSTGWGWIAFAAAGLAEALAAAASIKSATSGFASGGIIGGATTIGDYNLARVNKGEMILNGSQQAHLFDIINNNRLDGAVGGGNVQFVLRGADLYGSMKNYGKVQSKLGKNIGVK